MDVRGESITSCGHRLSDYTVCFVNIEVFICNALDVSRIFMSLF